MGLGRFWESLGLELEVGRVKVGYGILVLIWGMEEVKLELEKLGLEIGLARVSVRIRVKAGWS